ncbi:hypothetical protein KIF24_28555 [Micromonospora sp. Llam7]|uniref:hypothetical protein n=1 Tax=Micromonospora tarapacensis TaxID=2835305 RepID=UPI001C83419F|nr:hypothetical protein [Micromonospora tarapacensis]MBX7269571.1 hypothetical protein [Micromonospora tarapacensis]
MSRGRSRWSTPQPTCNPEGDLTAWPEQRYACDCGEELRLVRMSQGINDWAHETLSGQRHRDDRPSLLREDPARWWDELRRRMAAGDMRAAQIYSSVSAAEDLGWNLWRHYHHPATTLTDRPDRQPPYCCESPMWASPDGWACRVTHRLFRYTSATH